MSISRRIFMKVGTIAAIAAGLSLKPSVMTIAQELGNKVGTPAKDDPLSFYTQSTFLEYVNSVFRLHGPIIVDVILERVEDSLPAKTSRVGGRESFVLHFRGGSTELAQNTYAVEHSALGTFKLFLVPGGADENGAQSYTATINRLAYSANPGTVPRKSLIPKSTGSQTPEATPAGPPVELPEPQPQAPTKTLEPKAVPAKSPRKKNRPDMQGKIGFGIDN